MLAASVSLLLALAPAAGSPPPGDLPMVEVTGVVVDASGKPVAGAVIFVDGQQGPGQDLRRWRPWRDGGDLRGQSGADGSFRILVRQGTVNIMAGLVSDGLRGRAILVDAERPEQRSGLRLAFGGPAEIAGRVLDPDGSPVAGVSVRVFPEPAESSPGGGASFGVAPTDTSGRFRLVDLRPGSYRLYAEGAGWWCRVASVEGLPVKTGIPALVVPVQGMTSIRGRVTVPDGQGHRWAPARFVVETKPSGGWVFNTEDGRFEVPIYMPWVKLGVFVSAEGYGRLAFSVDLAKGEQKDLGDIELGPPRTVTGRVVDEAGAPVSGARVLLGYAGYAMRSDVITDSAGRFALPGVAASDAPLRLEPPGRRRTEAVAPEGQGDVEIRLGAGTEGVVDLRVEEADGRPLDGAAVAVAGEHGGRCSSAGGGHCIITDLAPGRYSLRLASQSRTGLTRPIGPDLQVDVTADGAPVTGRFRAARRPSSLQVHVATADGGFARAWVYVIPGEVGADGALGKRRQPPVPYYRGGSELAHRVANLPPDRYTVVAAAVEPAFTCGYAVIDLAEGEDRTIVVKVPSAGPDCVRSP